MLNDLEKLEKIKSIINKVKSEITDSSFIEFLNYGVNQFLDSSYKVKFLVDEETILTFGALNSFFMEASPSFQDFNVISLRIKNGNEVKEIKLFLDRENNMYSAKSMNIITYMDADGLPEYIDRFEEIRVIKNKTIVYKSIFESKLGLTLDSDVKYCSSTEEYVLKDGTTLRFNSITTPEISTLTYCMMGPGYTSQIKSDEFYYLLDRYFYEVLDVNTIKQLKKSMN